MFLRAPPKAVGVDKLLLVQAHSKEIKGQGANNTRVKVPFHPEQALQKLFAFGCLIVAGLSKHFGGVWSSSCSCGSHIIFDFLNCRSCAALRWKRDNEQDLEGYA
jgi:hypothetical protein